MNTLRPSLLALTLGLASVTGAAPATEDADNLLANPGFESITADRPDRWDHFVQPKPGAVARLDNNARTGAYAVWLHTPTPYDKEPVNNWSQNVIADFGGETLRVRGAIRVEEAREAALWLQCWRKKPWGVLSAASTSVDTPVYGTADWQDVSMDVPIPEGTDFVTLRCVLLGTGSAWFDDLSLTRVVTDGDEANDTAAEAAAPETTAPATTPDSPASEPPPVTPATSNEPAAAPSPSLAKQQEDAVMPLVSALEEEVRRLRDANLLLTDTLQQIQQVNEGLVKEVLAVQAELESLKAEEKEAAAPPLKARGVPPLVPLSEVPEREAP